MLQLRFHELVASKAAFTDEDYMCVTPSWAVFGAPEEGFDPVETRHYRKERSDGKPKASFETSQAKIDLEAAEKAAAAAAATAAQQVAS